MNFSPAFFSTYSRKSVYAAATLLLSIGAFVFFWRQIPVVVLLDLTAMAWMSTVPGMLIVLLLLSTNGSRITVFQLISLGTALGLCLNPALFLILRKLGVFELMFPVLSLLNVLLLLGTLFQYRRKQLCVPIEAGRSFIAFSIISSFVLLFLFLYHFANSHSVANGDIVARSLFGVDPTFLMSAIASIRDTGFFSDYQQMGIRYFYHDFTYLFLGGVARATHSELYDFFAHSSPIFSNVLVSISLYALILKLTGRKLIGGIAVAGWFLLGSFTGSEQGTSALSESFVQGNIVLLNALLLLSFYLPSAELQDEIPPTTSITSKSGLLIVLSIMSIALVRVKIPTYLVLEVVYGVLFLLLLVSRKFTLAVGLLPALILSLLTLLLMSGNNSALRPAGDFLIGAPVMGYANHLAKLLHVSVNSINPVSHGVHFQLKTLWLIPYAIFHFLRFALLDGRMWLVAFGIIVLRRHFGGDVAPKVRPELIWSMVIVIPIAFALPILYSPAWYPLAISFYTLLTSAQVATVVSALIIGYFWIHRNEARFKLYLGISVALIFGCFVGNTKALIRETTEKQDTIRYPMIQALRFVRDHSNRNALLATQRYNYNLHDTLHDEFYHIYSAFSERRVISAGAEYGSLLGATTPLDSVKGQHPVQAAMDTLLARRRVLDTLYSTLIPASFQQAARKYRPDFIIEDKSLSQKLALDPHLVADSFFSNSALSIWHIKY